MIVMVVKHVTVILVVPSIITVMSSQANAGRSPQALINLVLKLGEKRVRGTY
jgi:hypothetical protein